MFAILLSVLAFALPMQSPHTEIIETRDGRSITAFYYPAAKTSAPTLLIIHDWGGSSQRWKDIAQFITEADLQVVLFDLPGHGNSNATKPYYLLQGKEIRDFSEDLKSVIDHVIGKNTGEFYLMGAGLGANLAIIAAADDARVKKVVAISPGLDYRGIKLSRSFFNRLSNRIMLIASKEDLYSTHSIEALTRNQEIRVELGDNAGRGVWLLKRQSKLLNTLTQWLREK